MTLKAPLIVQNLDTIAGRMRSACLKAGRDPADVRLLAVSKNRGPTAIHLAADAGHRHFGENYLQESERKIDALSALDWHFIGAVQSNKTRQIANRFSWVHTVASMKVARRLSNQREARLGKLQVLIQVNISGEANKAGVHPDELDALIAGLVRSRKDLPGIRLRGLMAIPEAVTSPAAGASSGLDLPQARFAQLRTLQEDLIARYDLAGFNQLSMGMSQDYETAIMEGATWIRLGTAIFGPRQ